MKKSIEREEKMKRRRNNFENREIGIKINYLVGKN